VDDAGFGNDHAQAIALALMCADHDLQRGRIEKGAGRQIYHEQPLGADIGLGARDGTLEIFGIRNVELAEDVQYDDRIEIFANKCSTVI